MKVKVGDMVRILAGKDKGKEGKIIKTLKKDNKVIVEGINIIKKHMKPNRMNEVGSIVEVEAPIHASNVKLVENKKKETNKKTTKEASVAKEKKATTSTKKTTTAKKTTTKKTEKKAS